MIRQVSWVGVFVAAAGLAAAETLLAYQTSPLVAIGLPVAIVTVTLIFTYPMLGIYAGILAVPLDVLRISAGAIGLTPTKVLFLITATAAVVRFVGSGRMRMPHIAHLAFAGGLVMMAFGVLVARDTFVVQKLLVIWTMCLVLSILVASSDRKQIERILVCLAISGAILGLLGAVGVAGQQEVAAGGTYVSNRAQGTFTHPNQLAFFLELTIPLTLVLALRGPALLRLPMVAAAGISIAGLLFTLTRGGILGTTVSLLIMLAWTPFRRIAVALLCIFAVFGIANGGKLASSRDLSIVQTRLATVTSGDSRNNARLRIWRTTPSIIADHPLLGIGIANFPRYSLRYGLSEGGQAFEHAHNVPLTIGAELGVVGLALLIVFFWGVARTTLGTLRYRSHPDFPFALAVAAGLGALFFNSLTDYPPGSDPILAAAMIELGALIALYRRMRDVKVRRTAPPEPPELPALAGARRRPTLARGTT
ncbi:MAG: O-antigen ligase family protein [Solirubrobacteraceae bacterium]